MTTRARTVLGFGLLCLATIAIYAPSLRGGFVYDDHWAIVRNRALREAPAWTFWTDPSTGADVSSGLTHDVYRPLTVLSFAGSLRLWGGFAPGWRVENLCWHLLNGLLLILLLRRLGYPEGWPLLAAAAIFLLHPLQVSNVAWIYQRGALMSGAGCLMALWIACSPELQDAEGVAEGLCFLIAALFAKESAVVFPLLFWAIAPPTLPKRRVWLALSAACVGGFLLLRGALLGGWSQIADLPRGWGERAVLTIIALPQYAAKFFAPWGLRASYDLPHATPPRITLAVVGLIVFGGLSYRAVRQGRLSRGFLLWALAALIPTLPAAPIRAFFAERFFYLSSMGLAALIGLAVARRPVWRRIVLCWLAALGVTTARYAYAWRSEATLWAWTVDREPSNVFARLCLAEALPDPAAAEAQYRAALAERPSADQQLTAWNNLAVLALHRNDPRAALDWTDRVLARRPDHPQALYNRWRALKAAGDRAQAEALRQILKKDPRIPAERLN